MRITHLLTGAALALAIPALAQTPGRVPMPTPTPTASPTPDATAAPQQAMPGMTAPTPSASPAPTTPPDATTATPAAPAATTPIEPTVGATVYGSAGTPVGTIKDMTDQYVTLVTDKGEVKLPRAGVGPGLKGPVIGLTADQLNAAVTQAQAAQPTPAAVSTTKSTTSSKTKATKRR